MKNKNTMMTYQATGGQLRKSMGAMPKYLRKMKKVCVPGKLNLLD